MSGKALAGLCEIKRIPSHVAVEALRTKIDFKFSDSKYSAVRNLRYNYSLTVNSPFDKSDYGDIDFVIAEELFDTSNANFVTKEQIAEALGSKALAENGRVLSFEFEGHQLDLIRVPKETLRLNAILLGHHGSGYLLKFLPRPYGLKLTEEGLFEEIKDGVQTIGRAFISKDWNQVSTIFLEGAYMAYNITYGFKDQVSFFDSILGSNAFTLSAYYLDENFEYVGLPHRLEYKPFKDFVEYVKKRGLKYRSQSVNAWTVKPTVLQKNRLASRLKPMSQYQISKRLILEGHAQEKLIRSKFSGGLVKIATGLQDGPELGLFMEAYKASFKSRADFEFYMLSSSHETVLEGIQKFHKKRTMPTIVRSPVEVSLYG